MRHPYAALILATALACSGSTSDTTDGATDGATTTTTTTTTTTDATTTTTTTTTTDATTTTTTTTSTSTSGPETTTGTTAVTGTTADTTGDPGPCTPIQCEGKTYQCGDCIDNDDDGKIDGADVECLSPCDDDEGNFASGLPGDNMDPCNQDCYFDGNSGAGDDKCNWNLKCDPESPGGESCPYDPNYKNCPEMQSDTCLGFCPVPNGCDCFGCCTITVNGVDHDIYLGDKDCSVETIEECASCTKNEQCDNLCNPENCEVCFGQELPPGCEMPTCEDAQPCMVDAMGNHDCPDGMFCSTGCCVPIVPG